MAKHSKSPLGQWVFFRTGLWVSKQALSGLSQALRHPNTKSLIKEVSQSPTGAIMGILERWPFEPEDHPPVMLNSVHLEVIEASDFWIDYDKIAITFMTGAVIVGVREEVDWFYEIYRTGRR